MKRKIEKEFLPYPAFQAIDGLAGMVVTARRQRAMTQSDLAAKADVSLSTIVDIEKGSPSVQIGHWLKALWALDHADRLSQFVTPEQDTMGVQLMVHQLPKRIRSRRLTSQ